MSTVSTIIPTHDRARPLARALRSAGSQTRPADEIIVVDDGSSDETARVVRDGFPGVRYFRQENRGVSAARNRGIAAAEGEWLAFLDSDDEWLPRKLERQLAAFQESPGDLVCHTNETWIRHGRHVNPMKKHEKSGGHIFEKCLPLCAISPSSVIIHRKVFEELGTFDESLAVCEDYDLWLRICAVHPVLYIDEALVVKYGGHDDQLSRRYRGMDRFRIRALEKIIHSGKLDARQWRAALATLLEKIDIYLNGARKRDRRKEVEKYLKKKEQYMRLTPSSSRSGSAPPFSVETG